MRVSLPEAYYPLGEEYISRNRQWWKIDNAIASTWAMSVHGIFFELGEKSQLTLSDTDFGQDRMMLGSQVG